MDSSDTLETLKFHYKFMLGTDIIVEVPILLDANSLALIHPIPEHPPEWTRLSCCQCPNCPLLEQQTPYCPIAVNISELMHIFSDVASYQEVDVRVETDVRTYLVQCTAQDALSSILGIYMVTSGCPILDKLRPMARFHLPFSSYEETSYRAMSMYLVIQYLRYKQGQTADWDLIHFVEMYKNIQRVNHAIKDRLDKATDKDVSVNALIILDCFASLIMMDAEVKQLIPEQFESLFAPFLDE